ncbi:type III polyketide synthase [Heyndrickxia sporothermodurans]|uniref:Chalcone synthase n=2 Tax=Heyndrickxia sporothermodurans TaxID=46224 RepID=A0A150LA42_9BACI|nr:3-oxoacyl-[acyl-carrier-protein] synthase III C-terminal domain-containing protein [Heyndrickxia sporothermodurans]KYD09211.1 Chalcone synthase [Heyndrickxia sporothermodurans]MBL5767044.1 type III polyketide synthase [Heyndrickxia sporothermodurans]MBL5770511.1 type III polyketide synthase [Heyndrickxia sporothermodurans]MBL5774200.1 type III polyketide synthase [Heyndrickxia sporothermodurans]MBL5778066.1 type III polyketide synthase [Heyndrickxia sporothermodurans]
MPKICSVGLGIPPYEISQIDTMNFVHQLFSKNVKDINRLIKVFENGDIRTRYFVKDMDWFKEDHTFAEKNKAFIEEAINLGIKAIENCLPAEEYGTIDAIFTVCTSGLATPSIEARIMNRMPFREDVKRIPIWGLGCAGGAAGLSRAYEYCLAFPQAKVIVLSIEICSLTFQKNDFSKSNLIGTSLFADGAACTLVVGDKCKELENVSKPIPTIYGTESRLMHDSLGVMGWDFKDDGMHVIFSKDIPTIVENWLQPNVESFLKKHQLKLTDISQFIAHPGGKKVVKAYEKALQLSPSKTADTREVLKQFGNMSSPTIFYVLKRIMDNDIKRKEWGLAIALGPGFSSEQLLMRWE